MDIDRRTFVRQAGGLVVFVAASALAGVNFVQTATSLSCSNQPRGPLLAEGITFVPTPEGVDAFVGGTHVFSANQAGAVLLASADGTRSLDEIVAQAQDGIDPVEAALFYIELGKAGYLQNRVEVALVERSA